MSKSKPANATKSRPAASARTNPATTEPPADATESQGKPGDVLFEVRARAETGFRRCGRFWPGNAWTKVHAGQFARDDLARLKSDPDLKTQPVT